MSAHLRPGWYARTPDGSTESWWDGERWTGETRPTPGAQPTGAAPLEEESAKERIARRMVFGGLGAIGAVIVVTIGAMALGGNGSDTNEPEPDLMGESEARFVCEDFVRDRLKSPGSADFQRPNVSQVGNGRWQVDGTVDSENGFGALLRSNYSCLVRDGGDGSAHLVDLEFAE